ncbi:PAS domain S-box protein [Fodinicurvata fenggangensis]|uniref:PAS domain S-box protein n=1 Tax=Fodinicurvata fenggangensis TaxID=1121830 RepID=UPI0006894ABB|nr:PAS domain S-box protein [Fodinicurvata fenggangensis]
MPRESCCSQVLQLATRHLATPVGALLLKDAGGMRLEASRGFAPGAFDSAAWAQAALDGLTVVEDLQASNAAPPFPVRQICSDLRFLAAVPVIADKGVPVGLLWVADRERRSLLPEEGRDLQHYGELAGQLLEGQQQKEGVKELHPLQLELAEALPHMVWSARPDGVVDYISRYLNDFCGVEEIDAAAGEWLEMLHPDDRERTLQVWVRAREEETDYKVEFRIYHAASQNYRWHLVAARPQRDAEGRIVRWHGTTVDIHDQKQTEKQHEALLKAIPFGVHGVDAEGRVIFENPSAARMFGYQEGELMGQHAHDHFHHHHADGTPYPIEDCPIFHTLQDGQVRQVEDDVFFRKDGSSFPASYMAAPIVDAEGEITGGVVGFRDVTTERLEENLRVLEAQTLDRVSSASPLSEVLEGITESVDSLLPGVHSSVLLVENGRLLHGAAPGLPEDYNRTLDGQPIGDNAGSCGTAAWRGEPVIVSDIRSDPLWRDYRELADSCGLRACWSVPILDAKGKTMATFAVYYGEVRAPDRRQMELIRRISQYVRVAIERTRQHKRMEQSEARYRSLFNLVPVSIWEEDWSAILPIAAELRARESGDLKVYMEEQPEIVDEALQLIRTLDVNQASLEIFKAEGKHQLLQSLPQILDTPDSKVRLAEVLVALAEGKRTYQTEMQMRTMDGRTIHVLLGMALPELDASSGRVLVSLMDITARKEAEQRFLTVAQATNDVIWDWNLNMDRIWWNDGLSSVFGYELETGMTEASFWDSHLHPEDRERVVTALNSVLAQEQSLWQCEYRFMRADGSYAEVLDKGVIIPDEQGKPARMVGSLQDLTERRHLEAQLRQAQRLDAVGQLTGGVAHDFNNLLTVILGNIELLSERLGEDANLKSLVDMTARAADRGAELTSHLLAFSRQQPLKPGATDINPLVTEFETLLRRTLGETIEIELALSDDLYPAMVDPVELENAILNICLNARDAMPEGGRIVLETSGIDLREEAPPWAEDLEPGDYVALSITDNGLGMDQSTLEQAVEPFFTTKDVGKGSGLGLSMVYGFARQSKGHAHIDSAPGMGTRVTLYLPRAGADEGAIEDKVEEKAGSQGTGKILLVEDDALVRSHVSDQLSMLGYQVVACENGPAALEALQRQQCVDLLFTDIVMPDGMDGRELAEAAQRLCPDLPVLFTSGYSEELARRDNQDKTVHLLAKPYKRADLARKLCEALEDCGSGQAGQG